MGDEWRNEADYDRDRLERHVHRTQSATGLSRRDVLRGLLVTVAGGALGLGGVGGVTPLARARPGVVKPTPGDVFITRGTNRETRWDALARTGYLTPASHFFVRNHTLTPHVDLASYRLEITGSGVVRPLSLGYEDLLAFPSVTVTKAIECAGNGRRFFGAQQGRPASGTPWSLGAIGVASWTGVRLADILDRAGVRRPALDVMPVGLDPVVGANGNVRRPIPIEKALEDVLVVHSMNGDPLPEDHGFPARLLVPGWVGVANVKWLGRIEVSEEPLFSAWNTTQYRLFGDDYPDAPLVTTQVPKSAFALPFPATVQRGPRLLMGRAWSPEGTIRRVDVSLGANAPWVPARLHRPNLPGAWVRFSLPFSGRPGEYVLRARATDSEGNAQPETVPWNQQGYLFGAIVRHPLTVA